MASDSPEVSPAPLGSAREELGEPRPPRRAGAAATALASLGIVFGDIGTSPLYAMHTAFAEQGGAAVTESSVYGVASLIFWVITLVVSVKYVALVLRMDNHGEGGIMALVALVRTTGVRHRLGAAVLVGLGIFGASLFFGDGMITPAISVLSAVEGLEVAAPSVEHLVLPIALAILIVLFAVQRLGSQLVGRAFGPVMACWFTLLGVSGLAHVVAAPTVLRALSPTYAAAFVVEQPGVAFTSLAAVVLTVTGVEALYADLGHFGAVTIRRSWYAVVFPALVLNYLGQAALILDRPEAVANPFFLLFPGWARVPMVVVATTAAVIASQAVISGAFSVSRQAVQLGFLPRLSVIHTGREVGQVYVPAVNWILMVMVIGLVIGFGSSQALASAYGTAVTGTFAIDTILFFFLLAALWRLPRWLVLTGAGCFLAVDLTLFGATAPKILHGGWFPLAVAVIAYGVLTTWQHGRRVVSRERARREGDLDEFVVQLHGDETITRSRRTAIYLNAETETTPLALRATMEHNGVVPDRIVIVCVHTLNVPHVRESKRLLLEDLDHDGITRVVLRLGFQDRVDVPATLRSAGGRLDLDLESASYFVSRVAVVLTSGAGMARWRKRLFVAISRNAANPVDYFKLPDDRTIEVSTHIRL